jgi:CAAX prenyl protease-like protein
VANGSGQTEGGSRPHEGHGWWPYLLPYLGFLLAVEVAGRMGDLEARGALPVGTGLVLLALKPAVPLALIGWYWRRGAYPELRGSVAALGGAGGVASDVAVGLALTLLWALPYVFFPGIRPEEGGGFDPTQWGAAWAGVALGLRMLGYALVTPLFEELFIRSFVMRYAEVYGSSRDFRDVPIAMYTARSFLATVVIFTLGHVPWEWWVAVPWVALTNVWFYHRRNLLAIMIVHGVTNAALLLLAVFGSGLFHDADGSPLSLWFFV